MREQDYYERGYDDEPRRSKKAKKRKRKESAAKNLPQSSPSLIRLYFFRICPSYFPNTAS